MAKRSTTRRKARHSRGKLIPPAGRKRNPMKVDANGFTPQIVEFIRLYDRYLGNGRRAYQESHPTCNTLEGAAVGASRLLRDGKVRDAVDAMKAARWKRMSMEGDEALALIAQDARADMRELFDDKGVLLNPRDWPDDIAASVEAVDMQTGKIKLASKTSARRLILEQTGKIKGIGSGLSSLARLLAGDYDEETAGA